MNVANQHQTETVSVNKQQGPTPGPWRVAPAHDYLDGEINVDAGTRAYIACCGHRGDAQAEANASLIASAPDGLKVAQDFVAWVDQILTVRPMNQTLPGLQARYDEAKAFISQATGGQ